MTDTAGAKDPETLDNGGDKAPGEEFGGGDIRKSVRNYLIGLLLAGLLTAASFLTLRAGGILYAPAIPIAIFVFAIAQMGVHLVFFLHITTGRENINNTMALAFGVLVVFLLVGGSAWIIFTLNHNMMLPMSGMSGR